MDAGETSNLLVQTSKSILSLGQMDLALIFRVDQEDDIDQMLSGAESYEDDQGMERKQKRVRDLLRSLNRLSEGLFATIRVAERQITVLDDLHRVFLTCYQTKAKDYEKGHPLRRNPLHKDTITIPIFSGDPEQIWPNALDTVDEVVRERKCFIKKVEKLVENMDVRRKIV